MGRDRLLLSQITHVMEVAAGDEPWPTPASVTACLTVLHEGADNHEQQQRVLVPGAFTFPVFSLSQDQVARSQLGLERLHKLGVHTDPVLS